VERAEKVFRAVADTAEEIDRVVVPLLPADELKLMLHTGGLRFHYLLNLVKRTIIVTSITGARDAVGCSSHEAVAGSGLHPPSHRRLSTRSGPALCHDALVSGTKCPYARWVALFGNSAPIHARTL
jgi:hypothetical protein